MQEEMFESDTYVDSIDCGDIPRWHSGEEPTWQCKRLRDAGLIPGSGRSPGGRPGNPLQFCCLENPHGQKSLVGYSPWGSKDS